MRYFGVLAIAILLIPPTLGYPESSRSQYYRYRVELYTDRDFGGRRLLLEPEEEYARLENFNDRISSVRYRIPEGERVVLYEDSNFRGKAFEMRGSGRIEEIADLRDRRFNDKASSIRWFSR